MEAGRRNAPEEAEGRSMELPKVVEEAPGVQGRPRNNASLPPV